MLIDALSVLCAQLTRDLLAIAKFLFFQKLKSGARTVADRLTLLAIFLVVSNDRPEK